MRIRLTLDIERRPRPRPEAQREVQLDSYVERAQHQPIGFTASPGRDTCRRLERAAHDHPATDPDGDPRP